MSVAKRWCALSPAFFLSLWCGNAQSVTLCRVLPDSAALEAHCSFNLATATFADVVTAFHLTAALDSTQESVVALQTNSVQLSFGPAYSSVRDAVEPLRARVPVRSVMLRRYFATREEATAFLVVVRQRIEVNFTCESDTAKSDWPGMVCRDLQKSGIELRYVWTNWADNPNATIPFEITISARLS